MRNTYTIKATITYDGKIFPDYILTGSTMHFRFPDVMPENEYLIFVGLVVEAPIPYGETGNATFGLVGTDRERDSVVPGADFLLHAQRHVVAHGRIVSVREMV